MKQLQFIFSILLALCGACMFISMIIATTPVRIPALITTGGLFGGCILLVYILYKELKS